MLIQWHQLNTQRGSPLSTPYIEDSKGNSLHHPFAITDGVINSIRGKLNIKESTEWIDTLPDKSIVRFFLLGRKIIIIKENIHIDLNKIFIPIRLSSNQYNNVINDMQPDELININHTIYIYENLIYTLQDFKAFLNGSDIVNHLDRLERFLVNKIKQVRPIIKDFESFQKKLKILYRIKIMALNSGTTKGESKAFLNKYRSMMVQISDSVMAYENDLSKCNICIYCKGTDTKEIYGSAGFFCNKCRKTFYV